MLTKYFIKNSSIQSKLIIAFFLVSLIPISTFGLIFYRMAERFYEVEVSEASFKILDQISSKLGMIVDQTVTMSNAYYFDEDIRDILGRSSFENPLEEVQFNNIMKKKFNNYSSIMGLNSSHIAVIGMNGMKFKSWSPDHLSLDSTITQEVLNETIKNDGKLMWITSHENFAEDPLYDHVFTCVRLIKHPYVDKNLGILIISFSENILSDIYKNISDKNYKFLIVDEHAGVVSSLDKGVLGKKMDQPYIFNAIKGSPQYFTSMIDGKRTLVLSYPIKRTGWFIVQLTSVENLTENMRFMGVVIVLISMGCIVATFLLSYMIARRISDPIRKLVNTMKKVEKGDMNASVNITRKDEIGALALGFNRMISQIRRLLQELVQEERQKRKAEFEALQAQINPHFLYNSLTSIRCLLAKNMFEAVDDSVIALGRLLQQTFGEHKELIPILVEIENLNNYILLQKIRYGDKFDVSFQIEREVEYHKILPMMLQPLLENAIFHGIEPTNRKGLIKVTGRVEENRMKIIISDNGVGMSEEKMDSIFQEGKIAKHVFNQVGLKNIDRRIKLHFGEEFGLQITSVMEEGTDVIILIPVISGVEDNV